MNKLLTVLIVLLACASLRAQCVPGGLAVVVNKNNPTDSLSLAQLRKLMMGEVPTWPDKNRVVLVAADPGGALFTCVLSSVVRMSQQEYKKYTLSAEFRGEEPLTVRIVDSTASAVKTVGGSAGTLTVVEANSVAAIAATAPVKVVRLNGKQPGESGYPL